METLKLKATVGNIKNLTDFIENNYPELPKQKRNQLFLIIDEIFANICLYSYPQTENDGITVRMSYENDFFIEFEDKGLEFDPLQKKDPDIDERIKERKRGGMGIYIVKKIAKSVVYERQNDKNILSVIL